MSSTELFLLCESLKTGRRVKESGCDGVYPLHSGESSAFELDDMRSDLGVAV